MINIYCKHCHKHVPVAMIHDMNVRVRMCLDCRTRLLATPRVVVPPKLRFHALLPGMKYRILKD